MMHDLVHQSARYDIYCRVSHVLYNDHPAVCTDIMEGAAEAGRTGKVAPMSKTG